jgi:succinate-acetate transporter protein
MMRIAQDRIKVAEHDLKLANTIFDSLRSALIVIAIIAVLITIISDAALLSLSSLSAYTPLLTFASLLGLLFGIIAIYGLFAIAKANAAGKLKKPIEEENENLEEFLPSQEEVSS